MPEREITCPKCEAVQECTAEVGERIRCTECNGAFRVPEDEDEEDVEITPALLKKRRKAKRKAERQRLQKLSVLSTGLALHAVAVVVLFLSNIVFWFGALIAMIGAAGSDEALAVGGLVLLVAMALFGLAMLLQLPAIVMGFYVPDSGARGLLILSLGACCVVFVAIVGSFAVPDFPWVGRITAVCSTLGLWFLWLLFLYKVAGQFGDSATAQEALHHMWLGPLALLGMVVFLIIGAAILILIATRAWFVIFPLMIVAASFRGAMMWSEMNPLEILLVPTGIPYMIRYFNWIATIRKQISV